MTERDDHLLEVTFRHADGELTTNEVEQLRGTLLQQGDALDHYLETMELHGELCWIEGSRQLPLLPLDIAEAAIGDDRNESPDDSLRGIGRAETRWPKLTIASIAACVLLAIGLWLMNPLGTLGSVSATVVATYHAVWPREKIPLEIDDTIGHESVALLRGLVEFQMDDGPKLIVEGPAELKLIDAAAIQLNRGRLYCDLADGESMEVVTPLGTIRDLGTRFGVEVRDEDLLIQVYEGRVEIKTGPKTQSRKIGAHEAWRFLLDGDSQPVPFAAERFPTRIPTPAVASGTNRSVLNSSSTPVVTVERRSWPITIDGMLNDWPAEPGIACVADPPLESEYSARIWLGYDPGHLYVAARIHAPHGMHSAIDPHVMPNSALHGGCLQLLLGDAGELTSTRLRLWYFAETETACLAVNDKVNPAGFEGRFWNGGDGSYALEYQIPWNALPPKFGPPASGSRRPMLLTLTFSDETGRHEIGRFEELLKPNGDVARQRDWGAAIFAP